MRLLWTAAVAGATWTSCVQYSVETTIPQYDGTPQGNPGGASSGDSTVLVGGGAAAACSDSSCPSSSSSSGASTSSSGSSSSSSSSGGADGGASANPCSPLNARALAGGITFTQTTTGQRTLTIVGGTGADSMTLGGNNTPNQVTFGDNSGGVDVTFRCVDAVVVIGGAGTDRLTVGRPTGPFVDIDTLDIREVENYSQGANANIPSIRYN